MTEIFQGLLDAGFQAELISLSALDRYFRLPALPFAFVYTDGDLTDLARLFEKLRFPGPSVADAALDYEIPTAGVGGNPRTIFFTAGTSGPSPWYPTPPLPSPSIGKPNGSGTPRGSIPLSVFYGGGRKPKLSRRRPPGGKVCSKGPTDSEPSWPPRCSWLVMGPPFRI
jgi:hypothetical protein